MIKMLYHHTTKLFILLFFATGTAQAQVETPCGEQNLWINGTLEDSSMLNYQLNPKNAMTWKGLSNAVWHTKADTRWQNCGPVSEALVDHTTGTKDGHYLYVDPRDSISSVAWGAKVWQIRQSIQVNPNHEYSFSAWVNSMSLAQYSPAEIELVVNGKSLTGGNILLNTEVCPNPSLWTQISGIWKSGSNNQAIVDIVALNPIVAGHDFAMDDISFTCLGTTSIDPSSITNFNNLTLFPNPSNGIFQFHSNNSELNLIDEVQILDLSGRQLQSHKHIYSDTKFSLEGFSKGTYIILVNQNGHISQFKLLLN